MSRLLVHVTTGPEDETKAALAFLVARTAVEEGHETTMFLAGDGVSLILDHNIDAVTGVGTGTLRESFDGFVAAGGRLFLSRNSSKARAIGDEHLAGKPAEFATPHALVDLALEHDRVLTY